MPTLQEKFDASKSDSFTLTKDFEYGTLTITRPCIIDGKGATIFASSAPVVLIQAANVRLRNLRICVKNGQGVAISTKFRDTKLENVEVNGVLEGFTNENPSFILPTSIFLGSFKSGKPVPPNTFLEEIRSPARVTLESNIYGVDIHPQTLNSGKNKLCITVNDVDDGTSIHGYIKVKSAEVTRRIWIFGEGKNDVRYYGDKEEISSDKFIVTLQNSSSAYPFVFLLNDKNKVYDDSHVISCNNNCYKNGVVEIKENKVSIDLRMISDEIKAIALHYLFGNFSNDVSVWVQSETNIKRYFKLKRDTNILPSNIRSSLALTLFRVASGWNICFLGKYSPDSLEKIGKRYGL